MNSLAHVVQGEEFFPAEKGTPEKGVATVTPELFAPLPVSGVGQRDALIATLLEDYLRIHLDAVAAVKNKPNGEDPVKQVELLARLSLALDRTLRALGKASPRLSRLAVAKEVLERQAEFIKQRFPQHLVVFIEILEPFAREFGREAE